MQAIVSFTSGCRNFFLIVFLIEQGGAEREQGLLQILTEMDGFKVSTSQVMFSICYLSFFFQQNIF